MSTQHATRALVTAALAAGVLLATACGRPAGPAARPIAPTSPAAKPGPTATAAPTASPQPMPELPLEASPQAETCAEPLGCYGEPRRAGAFDAEAVPGASGLAASRRNPGVLYLVDDRPGTSEVWAVAPGGMTLGPIGVSDLDALDTEALAVGPCGPEEPLPCVFVGDVGDNLRSRGGIAVHRFGEPDLSDGAPSEPVAGDVARWTYPDGPHDAEALLVDDAGTPFIVTKAPFDADTGITGEARLYRAPGFADGVLEDLGVLPVPEPVQPLHSVFVGNVVTGGDYLDGRVLLRTYDQALEYVAVGDGADLTTLPEWSVRAVPAPIEPQSEAIAWAPGGADGEGPAHGPDGCGYYTVGEIVGDIWYVPCVP